MFLPPPEVLGSLRTLRRPLPSWAHELALRSTSHAASWSGRCDVDDALATRLLLIADMTDDNWFWPRDVVTTMYARTGLDLVAIAGHASSPFIASVATALIDEAMPPPIGDAQQTKDNDLVFKTFHKVRFGNGVARTTALNTVRRRGVSPVGLRSLIAGFVAYKPDEKVLFDLAKAAQAHVDMNLCPEYLCNHHGADHHDNETTRSDGFCFIGLLATFNPAAVNRLAPGALVSVLDAVDPARRDAAVKLLSTMDSTSRLSVADVAETAALL